MGSGLKFFTWLGMGDFTQPFSRKATLLLFMGSGLKFFTWLGMGDFTQPFSRKATLLPIFQFRFCLPSQGGSTLTTLFTGTLPLLNVGRVYFSFLEGGQSILSLLFYF